MAKEESLEEQVERHDRDLRDHAKSLSSIIEKLTVMETAAQERAIRDARAEERAIARGEALDDLKKQVAQMKVDLTTEIGSIKGVGKQLVMAVVTAIILAFLGFVFKGGLTI